jgi:uncharacterized protein (TIGR02391 family)
MSFVPPAFSSGRLEEVSRILGDEVSGSQLGRLMAQARITDTSQESTKWKRLCYSMASIQQRRGNGKAVIAAIHAIMDPSRFASDPAAFDAARARLNVVLAFSQLGVGEDGRVVRLAVAAQTLDEARERADRLGAELRRRDVHEDVLRFCRAELLRENYFHAVLEAAKSVADKVREVTGLDLDGAELFDAAFSLNKGMPPLAFNRLETQWDQSEHKGLSTLAKGLHATYRNPTAHAPKIKWATDRAEALDMLTLASMLHRRLDAAAVTPAAPAYRD